jgi:hypothetical protein
VPAETTPGNAENARVAFDLTTGRAFASGTGGNPDVAFDPSGVAHVAWEQVDGAGVAVFANRFE